MNHFKLLGIEIPDELKRSHDSAVQTTVTLPVSRIFKAIDGDGKNIFEFGDKSRMRDVKKKIKVLDILPAELSRAMDEQPLTYDPTLIGNLENYNKHKTKFLENYAAGNTDKKTGLVKIK